MAHHHAVPVEEAEDLLSAFYRAHDQHGESFVWAGEWAISMSCPKCNVLDTIAVDNFAFREAAYGDIKAKGAVLF